VGEHTFDADVSGTTSAPSDEQFHVAQCDVVLPWSRCLASQASFQYSHLQKLYVTLTFPVLTLGNVSAGYIRWQTEYRDSFASTAFNSQPRQTFASLRNRATVKI
jgi:hypothetical protein